MRADSDLKRYGFRLCRLRWRTSAKPLLLALAALLYLGAADATSPTKRWVMAVNAAAALAALSWISPSAAVPVLVLGTGLWGHQVLSRAWLAAAVTLGVAALLVVPLALHLAPHALALRSPATLCLLLLSGLGLLAWAGRGGLRWCAGLARHPPSGRAPPRRCSGVGDGRGLCLSHGLRGHGSAAGVG